MRIPSIFNSRRSKRAWLFFLFIATALCFATQKSSAHQTPTTIVLLDINPGNVQMELQLPLSELELAFGHDVMKNTQTLAERLGPQLREYLLAHIHPFVTRDMPWQVVIKDIKVEEAMQAQSGPAFQEITVHLVLTPPAETGTRKFTLDYDVIMHQVINHAAFVSIRNDWELGRTEDQRVEAGVIHWDTKNNVIHPLEINLEQGSWRKGFLSMLALGMQHIKEGTDHLLFLLVLLLPAMLLVNGKNWGSFGGTKYSILRLLKIITAFTIGHSVTLLIGAMGWVKLPAKPVEILIAISILFSAIHAIKPVFSGKESYVAAGFGLVHGLAFASVLYNLNLSPVPMSLSILGFNLGIELMQLFVVVAIVPWLILLSKTNFYRYVRIGGAVVAGIAALAWIAERTSGSSNPVSNYVSGLTPYGIWCIATLAIFSLISYLTAKTVNR